MSGAIEQRYNIEADWLKFEHLYLVHGHGSHLQQKKYIDTIINWYNLLQQTVNTPLICQLRGDI